tara:strand:+ start:354 stop:524 length:171 start_codon:yes stop_codon:yes gene_type:complete
MEIDNAVLQKVINYLTQRPYREVHALIVEIMLETQTDENIQKQPELPLENVGGRSS